MFLCESLFSGKIDLNILNRKILLETHYVSDRQEVLQSVNAALYLDLDTLVTGDISLLWSSLYKMDESQLVAMSRNTEPEDKVNINFEDNTFEGAIQTETIFNK